MKTSEPSVALITEGNRAVGLQTRHDQTLGRASGTAETPLDETHVEFDEDNIDRMVDDVRDRAHLDTRRATQDKYE